MTTELQNKVWSILPKEFKEEVKEIYLNAVEHHPCGYNHETDLMKYLFGRHNLTSDEEEEEILTCKKSEVQRAYNTSREIVKAENPDSLMYSMHTQIMYVLESIFGSKCLPDANEDNFASIEPKTAQPKFKIGDELVWDKRILVKIDEVFADGKYLVFSRSGNRYMVKESDLEPYTEPKDDRRFDNTLKDGFREHNRLHIAAMIAQGIMANSNPQMVDTNVERVVDLAILTADTLIAKCEKGASK